MFLKIIDNFLTKSYFKELSDLLTGDNFEWWYTNPDYGHMGTQLNGYGFTHGFWDVDGNKPTDRFVSFIQPVLFQTLDATNCDFILRARADMVTWSGKEEFVHPAHVDYPFPHTAAVFYINESNGDTVFYNVYPKDVPKGTHYKELKEYNRVSPKPNRLIIFDGDLLHTGSSPTKYQNRIVLNSDYIKKEYTEIKTNNRGNFQGFNIIERKKDQENFEAMRDLLQDWENH